MSGRSLNSHSSAVSWLDAVFFRSCHMLFQTHLDKIPVFPTQEAYFIVSYNTHGKSKLLDLNLLNYLATSCKYAQHEAQHD